MATLLRNIFSAPSSRKSILDTSMHHRKKEHMQTWKALYHHYRELILYGIIGCFCAGLDFAVYTILGLCIPYLLANIISVHCGIFCSFFLNRQYNFKVKDKTAQRFTLFYLVGLSGLGLSELLIFILGSCFRWDYVVAKLLTIIVVALFQFVLNKLITFKRTDND